MDFFVGVAVGWATPRSSTQMSLADSPLAISEDNESIVAAWHRQIANSANRVAIVSEDSEWSYEQMESSVDTIARRLTTAGIGV